MAKPGSVPPSPHTPMSGCLLRAYWLLLGNAALVLSALVISWNRETFFSAADPVFWVLAASLLVARFLDITRCHGTTGTGEPATIETWYRYAGLLVPVALLVWGLAHAWAHFTR